MLDVEGNLHNRPLPNIGEALEYLVLIPNSMILGRYIKLPVDSPEEEEVCDSWMKKHRYVHKCKEAAWRKVKKKKIKKTVKNNISDVVMIKGVEKNQGKWEI